MKSYHVFTLSVGKHAVERIYIDEEVGTREDAIRRAGTLGITRRKAAAASAQAQAEGLRRQR